jgi:hypothetical protein
VVNKVIPKSTPSLTITPYSILRNIKNISGTPKIATRFLSVWQHGQLRLANAIVAHGNNSTDALFGRYYKKPLTTIK